MEKKKSAPGPKEKINFRESQDVGWDGGEGTSDNRQVFLIVQCVGRGTGDGGGPPRERARAADAKPLARRRADPPTRRNAATSTAVDMLDADREVETELCFYPFLQPRGSGSS